MSGQSEQATSPENATVVTGGSDRYFEMYKLAVEMADRVSVRRITVNSFFLTVNTGAAALLGMQNVSGYLAAAGLAFSSLWWTLLKSYRSLNHAKFKIIVAMEEQLPARIYGDEWELLHRDRVGFSLRPAVLRSWLAQYRGLGFIERIVPGVFMAIYLVALVRQLFG